MKKVHQVYICQPVITFIFNRSDSGFLSCNMEMRMQYFITQLNRKNSNSRIGMKLFIKMYSGTVKLMFSRQF